jgi:hypothetical protein
MAFRLDEVAPWGRGFDEYAAMFNLTGNDLVAPILGCADGPASFNAEADAREVRVVSADPLYRFDATAIAARIEAARPQVIEQTRANADRFVWDRFPSVDELVAARMRAMRRFLRHYARPEAAGRYVAAALPHLPFQADAFALAVCSHYLFLYSEQLDFAFHLAAVDALLTVARDVRIYPVVDLNGDPSRHLEPLTARLLMAGCSPILEPVDYRFQRNARHMLWIRR